MEVSTALARGLSVEMDRAERSSHRRLVLLTFHVLPEKGAERGEPLRPNIAELSREGRRRSSPNRSNRSVGEES